jgi:uncharacterized DUF497 family protein
MRPINRPRDKPMFERQLALGVLQPTPCCESGTRLDATADNFDENLTPRRNNVDPTTGHQHRMHAAEFERPSAKLETNWHRNGVSIDMARDVFRGPFAIEWADLGQIAIEPHTLILGMVEGRLLYVSYTERQNRVRIILARLAEPFER